MIKKNFVIPAWDWDASSFPEFDPGSRKKRYLLDPGSSPGKGYFFKIIFIDQVQDDNDFLWVIQYAVSFKL